MDIQEFKMRLLAQGATYEMWDSQRDECPTLAELLKRDFETAILRFRTWFKTQEGDHFWRNVSKENFKNPPLQLDLKQCYWHPKSHEEAHKLAGWLKKQGIGVWSGLFTKNYGLRTIAFVGRSLYMSSWSTQQTWDDRTLLPVDATLAGRFVHKEETMEEEVENRKELDLRNYYWTCSTQEEVTRIANALAEKLGVPLAALSDVKYEPYVRYSQAIDAAGNWPSAGSRNPGTLDMLGLEEEIDLKDYYWKCSNIDEVERVAEALAEKLGLHVLTLTATRDDPYVRYSPEWNGVSNFAEPKNFKPGNLAMLGLEEKKDDRQYVRTTLTQEKLDEATHIELPEGYTINWEDIPGQGQLAQPVAKVVTSKCDCGAEIAGLQWHYDWCNTQKRD